MNSDEISKLQSHIEGAFPNSKLSPSKVFDAWCLSKVLIEFPNQRRADLTRYIIDHAKEFPTLAQLEAAARTILRREQPAHQTCLICDDTGWIHYELTERNHPDGSAMFTGDVFTERRVKVVAGNKVTLSYNGVPLEYAHPKRCPACNH